MNSREERVSTLPNPVDLTRKHRIVAIIRLDDLSCAVPLTRALYEGGIVVQEFTLTNPNALEAVRRTLDGIEAFSTGQGCVGVGSVRSRQQAEQAIEAGAHFVVTPIYSLEVLQTCRSANVPVFCGAFTPTEIHRAWQAGASIVKVFPARGLGPRYIQDVLAPMPELPL